MFWQGLIFWYDNYGLWPWQAKPRPIKHTAQISIYSHRNSPALTDNMYTWGPLGIGQGSGPLATSEFEIQFALSKLTKRSDKLFKFFQTSHSLRPIFYHSISPNRSSYSISNYDFCVAKRNSLFCLR